MTVADRPIARAATGRGLGQVLAAARAGGRTAPMAWVSIATAALDPVGLFAAARAAGHEAALWLQPAAGRSLVGIGRAWATEPSGPERFATAAARWRELVAEAAGAPDDDAPGDPVGTDGGPVPDSCLPASGPLLLGALGFSGRTPGSGETAEPWASFGAASLVLPTFTLIRDGGRSRVVVAVGPEQVERADAARLELTWASLAAAASGPASPLDRRSEVDGAGTLRPVEERPDRAAWDRIVGLFAGGVGRGRIDKVVLARRVSFEAAGGMDLDLEAALRHLAATAPESTTFAFSRGDTTFLGATPERLVRTAGRSFETVAIAGSAARGRDAAEDARLADELLRSEKDREEHAVVVDAIRAGLAPIVESLVVAAAPVVLRLRHVQHLRTPISGTLRHGAGLLSLAERLHPTPAVGGSPRAVALDLIAEHEHFDRGWYAGPIGWLGADGDGELMVALRCGLVTGRKAVLFAGCGIVADSDPGREWEESRLKLRAMGAALGGIAEAER